MDTNSNKTMDAAERETRSRQTARVEKTSEGAVHSGLVQERRNDSEYEGAGLGDVVASQTKARSV